MKLLILACVVCLAAVGGCVPWDAAPPPPAHEPLLAAGNANNLYVASVGATGGATVFKYWQRDARGTWRAGGVGQGTPRAWVACREDLLVFFPSGRYGRFGLGKPEVFAAPAQGWTPAAACEDGLAVDALGWTEAENQWLRLEDGKDGRWTAHTVDVPLERDKIHDPSLARFEGRLFFLWREEMPTLTEAEKDFRLRFVYLDKGKWQGPYTAKRLQIDSPPLIAAAGNRMIVIYRKPGESVWTLGTYVTADDNWFEVKAIDGAIPPGPLTLAAAGSKFYLAAQVDQRPVVAELQLVEAQGSVVEAKVGEFKPVETAEEATRETATDGPLGGWLLFSLSLVTFFLILVGWQRARRAMELSAPGRKRPGGSPIAGQGLGAGSPVGAASPLGAEKPVIILYASLLRRGVAVAIDSVLVVLLMAPMMASLMPHTLQYGNSLQQGQPPVLLGSAEQAAMVHEYLIFLGLSQLILVIYFTATEWTFGRTLGKLMLSLEVRSHDGGRATFKQILVRNLFRIIDVMPGFYIVGVISILIGPRPERLGDRAAHTAIVVASSPKP
jgi:uncharacterized RDD family membrane protein YckC